MPKGSALVAAEKGIGFPATRKEIQSFGLTRRSVVQPISHRVDGRSFAAVAMEHRGPGQRGSGGALSRLGGRVGPG